MRNKDLIEKLKIQRGLAEDEWVQIIDTFDEEDLRFAMDTGKMHLFDKETENAICH